MDQTSLIKKNYTLNEVAIQLGYWIGGKSSPLSKKNDFFLNYLVFSHIIYPLGISFFIFTSLF